MIASHLLRVFTDATGNFGNPVSIIVDEGKRLDDAERQMITGQLGHDETVFVNDLAGARVSIFNPQQEVPFAGHAMVGTARLLAKLSGKPIEVIHCLGGDIATWQDGELAWIRAGLDMMPPWQHKQLDTAEAVECITKEEAAIMPHTMVWAWVGNEAKGLLRARTFASDWDIPEAEANGSGSMMLAALLKRAIEIKHGKGSMIYAKPAPNSSAEVGGRVVEAPARQ
jgi:predicted PhzF superfamily epimerase YddE/YHI9